ncbi:putative secreted protein [Listeria monocytogenes]|uniref:hypothetical protein n=1 Tax=Listeria monocytogenes TaxID=1639 RepID=UPI000A1D4872|nr:hypothetical protein [Listeria monocytogenes]ARM71712.1 putative secreted protein [Listeria monocytogenes]
MKKILFLLLVCVCLLFSCKSENLAPKSFQYGEVLELDKGKNIQIMKNKLYLFSEASFPNDGLEGRLEFNQVNNDLQLENNKTLALTNLETRTVLLSAYSANSNPSEAISVFNSSKQVGIVAGPDKYIPISKELTKKKGRYIETGAFSNGENAILFFNQASGMYTLTRWGSNKKINKEANLTDITKEKELSVEDMVVFEDIIYLYSNKTNKIYAISPDLTLINAWEVGEDMKNISPEKWGSPIQFVAQRELHQLFIYNENQPEKGFYEVNETGVKKWAYGQEKYRDKYILAINKFYNLYDKQIVPNNSQAVHQAVLTTDGDYYFTTTQDLSNPQKKTEEEKIYLTKINKQSLPAFIEELKTDPGTS